MRISVVILAKNNARTIKNTLASTIPFDEVIVADSGSTDGTIEIARSFPHVNVISHRFTSFGDTRNTAAQLAKNDWIMALDSDEVVSPELAKSILELPEEPNNLVYSYSVRNFYQNKWIRSCGWYPDQYPGIYHRKATGFTDAEVHESLILDNVQEVEINGYIEHYSYTCIADFLNKMQSYSTLFAKQYQGKRHSSVFKAIFRAGYNFFKNYILQKGFMDGYEGFLIATYNSTTTLFKYLKLREANRSLEKKEG